MSPLTAGSHSRLAYQILSRYSLLTHPACDNRSLAVPSDHRNILSKMYGIPSIVQSYSRYLLQVTDTHLRKTLQETQVQRQETQTQLQAQEVSHCALVL